MFLSKIANKIGLFDVLAPRKKKENEHRKVSDPKTPASVGSFDASGEEIVTSVSGNDPYDDNRRRRLRAQIDAEDAALALGVFAKKQRVKYHHKATNKFYDAVIVGVHLDDGPDKPYYTITYDKLEAEVTDDGKENKVIRKVEKQTYPERLERLNWDEAKAW
eukprot:CAMPEP_0183295164 /NCGR_PEP_ID=MMETSP0160_2-20130417/3223_1 /TAXON_ID=2839 ORGANISM="Odontella Sinensis, Strain Grunow 1884" /NCGR_SAMPLE_ID=MMETSP0160_2 /ASSEMBLY_ACC=CAM_ASM_000250 /LENGTH=161 /DNA_ID=CAMNT_0025456597 /DNA_START=110 /DNA_END=592 /DNA_ORIENTATION=+